MHTRSCCSTPCFAKKSIRRSCVSKKMSGGSGILHKDFNNANNAASNLVYVNEMEARKALAAFVE